MRYTEIDKRIDALAAKQHGAFSRQQAFDRGASERFVTRRLAERVWIRPAYGVYALARSPGTWRRQCMIAVLAVEGGAIAGRAAAALHALPGFNKARVEVLGAVNAWRGLSWATHHRYAGAKVTEVDGIAATTVAQTLCDIAAVVKPWPLERAMDHALLEQKVTIGELDERLTFYDGSRRPGLPRIRPLVVERRADGYVPPESELEALMSTTLDRVPGRPRVVRQAKLDWLPQQHGRVDFYLPDHCLVIEADGRRWHTRVADFERDLWRDNLATANGHRVMRFTWVHLTHLVDDVVELIDQTVTRRTSAA